MRREHTQKRISRLISHERCKQKKIALHCFAAFHMEVSSCIINSIDEIRQESLSCKKEINFYFHISDSNFFPRSSHIECFFAEQQGTLYVGQKVLADETLSLILSIEKASLSKTS